MNTLREAEYSITILKLNDKRITEILVNRDDYLEDYIKEIEYEFQNIKKDMYKYTKKG
jgi:anti-sigma-K factor RskA